MSEHTCCACFTHNNLPCCNDGHVDYTGVQYVRKAWARSPLLRSIRAVRDETAIEYQTDHTTLPATCSPRCNPGMHDLIECRTPLPKWTPSKPPRDPDWPGVGTLRPRSDEEGEVDDELSDWRAAEEYGA